MTDHATDIQQTATQHGIARAILAEKIWHIKTYVFRWWVDRCRWRPTRKTTNILHICLEPWCSVGVLLTSTSPNTRCTQHHCVPNLSATTALPF